MDGNGGDNNIRAQMFDASGTTIGEEFIVNTPTAPFSYEVKLNPTIEVLANGNFVIAWDQPYSGTYGILARVYDQGGVAVSDPFLAGTYSNSYVSSGNDSAIVQAGGDQFWIISTSQVAYGNYGLFRQLVHSDGTVEARQTVAYSIDAQVFGGAEVATLADGHILVSCRETDAATGTITRISARLFDAAFNAITPSFEIAPLSSQGGLMPLAVTALLNGGFAINWGDYDPDTATYSTQLQLFDASAAPTSDILLLDQYNLNGVGGDVTVLADGNILVTWSGFGTEGVTGQIIDSSEPDSKVFQA